MTGAAEGGVARARAYLSGHKKGLFIVFLIFLLGLAVRGQLMSYGLMFEFDSFFYSRIVEYIVTHNFIVPAHDPLAYFELASQGGAPMPDTGQFFWLLTALLFKAFTFYQHYSQQTLIDFVKIIAAVFGALTCVAMYFLGKELYGRKAGITMGVFAAVVPAYVYRTMAGWLENDGFAFLPMVIGFYFFVKAVKRAEFSRQTLVDSVLAALFFAVVGWSWDGFLMVPIILGGWIVMTLALMWLRNDGRDKIINVSKNFAVVFVLMFVLVSAVIGPGWSITTVDYLAKYLPISQANIRNLQAGHTVAENTSVYSVSVGEEATGLSSWGYKYNVLIVFPFIALAFLAWRVLKRKDDYASLLFVQWIVLAAVMAYTKLKFTYYFGLPVAAGAGVVLFETFNLVGDRQSFEKKTVAICLGFLFISGIAAGTYFVTQNVPQIEDQSTGWKESVYWIRDNIPKDANIFNWWDEGHWVTFIGQRSVSTDNRNMVLEANRDAVLFMLATSENDAYKIVRDYNANYVLLSEDLIGKMNSLAVYAYGVNDPRVNSYFSGQVSCGESSGTAGGQPTVQCGQNLIPKSQFESLPYQKISQPNELVSPTQKAFVYRNEAGTSLFILNKAANSTFIVSLFFDIGNVRHFKLIYSDKQVRMYKVVD